MPTDDRSRPATPPVPMARASGGTSAFRRLARLAGAGDRLPIDPDLAPDDAGEPSPTHRAGGPHVRRARPSVLAAIVAGGFLGTLGRYELGLAWPAAAGRFPAATFVINTSGAFLLGLLLSLLLARRRPATHLRPFAATGLLGGWTTYSTLVVDADTLAHRGDLVQAAGYLALTLVAGVSAVAVGIALGRWLAGARPEGEALVAAAAYVAAEGTPGTAGGPAGHREWLGATAGAVEGAAGAGGRTVGSMEQFGASGAAVPGGGAPGGAGAETGR